MRLPANRVIESERRWVAIRGMGRVAPERIRFLRLPNLGVSASAKIPTSPLAHRCRLPCGLRPCVLSLIPLLVTASAHFVILEEIGPTQPDPRPQKRGPYPEKTVAITKLTKWRNFDHPLLWGLAAPGIGGAPGGIQASRGTGFRGPCTDRET